MKLRPACLAILLLSACSVHKDGMTGEVLSEHVGPGDTVTATLTRDGDVYRLYLSSKSREPWEMLRAKLADTPIVDWENGKLVMLDHVCGHVMEYPHGTGNGYPRPGTSDTVQAGFNVGNC